MRSLLPDLKFLQTCMQYLSLTFLCALALGAVTASALAFAGVLPWLDLPLAYGGEAVPQAGMIVQLGVTVLLLSFLFFLPTNFRVMQLENSHRRFNVTMTDVARAYHAAHAADRAGVFKLPSEFDSVKERLQHMRNHPDLGSLEPEVLELAAQMSHLSRDLAETYGDDRVARAKEFLAQRQEEVDEFEARIADAHQILSDLKRWHERVALDEDVAKSQLDRLREELSDLMPEIFIEPWVERRSEREDDTVVPIAHAAE